MLVLAWALTRLALPLMLRLPLLLRLTKLVLPLLLRLPLLPQAVAFRFRFHKTAVGGNCEQERGGGGGRLVGIAFRAADIGYCRTVLL